MVGGWLLGWIVEEFLLILHIADAAVEQFELLLEFINAAEFVVLAGETDVGNFVDVAQPGHDAFADDLAGDFAIKLAMQFLFEFVDDFLFDVFGDFAFAAGGENALGNFLALEGNAAAITLHDDEARGFFDTFIRRETSRTAQALAPATDHLAAIAAAAVDDFVVVGIAVRTLHGQKVVRWCAGGNLLAAHTRTNAGGVEGLLDADSHDAIAGCFASYACHRGDGLQICFCILIQNTLKG